MKVVTLFSGGLDSTTLAYLLRAQGHEQTLLSLDYGQRHRRELDAARVIADELRLPWHTVRLPLSDFLLGSCLTDATVAVPEGHYADPVQQTTVVPHRNLLFLTVAATYAAAHGMDAIAYAPHAGDAAIYPDCRPEFVSGLRGMLYLSLGKPADILTPFLSMTKREVAELARELSVPIKWTWSCYAGGAEPCGKCGACVERAEALT